MGEGAIAVLRLSGSEAKAIVSRIFRGGTSGVDWGPRRLYLGEVSNQDGKIDQVLGTYFPAPPSYTGQDLVEISCHRGGLVLPHSPPVLLSQCARSARPGGVIYRPFF